MATTVTNVVVFDVNSGRVMPKNSAENIAGVDFECEQRYALSEI